MEAAVNDALRLMCILAHPDDESLGTGGILARYAAEGAATYLVTATRGECGWQGDPRDDPGPQALGAIREAELRDAARVLGVGGLSFLDYLDGELDQADPEQAVARIVGPLRRFRPQVVVTFAPDGATGHPDHIAISQLTGAALVAAADSSYAGSGELPHRVSKLYYFVDSREKGVVYNSVFGDTAMTVDGVKRAQDGWPDWAITTRVSATTHWRRVWQAIACHRSQLPGYDALTRLPDDIHKYLWGVQEFYRAFSLVNVGRAVEDDLFAGLR
jgi:LmbE family N-acetylglucosaminyl deacetylase